MKRIAVAIAIAGVVAATRMTISAQPPQAGANDYIVVLHDDDNDPNGRAGEHGRAYGLQVSHVYRSALKGYAARISDARIDDVRNDPSVAFVSEDRPVYATAQTTPTGIRRIEADQSPTFNAGAPWNISVAVVDTGSGPHADLNVVGGKNCSTGQSFSDGNGHGTHVAGTIGAKNDGNGVVGVAPGIPIYSVRVLNNAGSGSWSSIACGLDWVAAHTSTTQPIKVVNMSLGGSGTDGGASCATTKDALYKSICGVIAKGITVVVAAGNDNADMKNFVPAAYDETLAVTAVADFDGLSGGGAAATCRSDVDDTSANFSNYATVTGDKNHTIAAPGVCITSTWKQGGYDTISGTSMASPHVAGTAALCIASGVCTGGPSGVIATLRSTAAGRPAGYGFTADSATKFFGSLVWAGGY